MNYSYVLGHSFYNFVIVVPTYQEHASFTSSDRSINHQLRINSFKIFGKTINDIPNKQD